MPAPRPAAPRPCTRRHAVGIPARILITRALFAALPFAAMLAVPPASQAAEAADVAVARPTPPSPGTSASGPCPGASAPHRGPTSKLRHIPDEADACAGSGGPAPARTASAPRVSKTSQGRTATAQAVKPEQP